MTIYCDKSDIALYFAEIFNYMQFKCSKNSMMRRIRLAGLGRMKTSLCDDDGHLLDYLDIINASTVHGNVGEVRHCYFDLSREVISDVRELIVERKRAISRDAKLVRQEGNFFEFLVAPPYVHH